MSKARLECFSDGVIAVIITIMVFELKVPHGTGAAALLPLVPTFLSYILSFFFLYLYWNQHHHLLHATKQINGSVMWANLHLLFWLSLIPFATGYMDQNNFSGSPVALYGGVMFMAGTAYYILQRALIAADGKDSLLVKAVGKKRRSRVCVADTLASGSLDRKFRYMDSHRNLHIYRCNVGDPRPSDRERGVSILAHLVHARQRFAFKAPPHHPFRARAASARYRAICRA